MAASLWGAVVLLRQAPVEPPAAPAGQGPAQVAAQRPAARPAAKPVVEQEDGANTEFAWDDSLDTRIADVRRMLRDTRQSWAYDRQTYTIFQQRLYEMERSLEQESL